MPTMKPPFKSLSPRYRRLLVVPALLAVFLAAVITTTNDFEGSTVSVLPGATADPTGPPTGGPGGDGGFNGGQFQPPGMPSHQGDTTAALIRSRGNPITAWTSTHRPCRHANTARHPNTHSSLTHGASSRYTAPSRRIMTDRSSRRHPRRRCSRASGMFRSHRQRQNLKSRHNPSKTDSRTAP